VIHINSLFVMAEQSKKGQPTNTENKNNTTTILGVLLLLCALAAGFLFVQNMNLKDQVSACGKEVDQTEIARQNVISELNDMELRYTELSETNETMSEELLAQRERVKQLLTDAKNKDWTLGKLKKETNTLREIMKGYLHTIDSLNTLNQELTAENTSVKTELSDQKNKYTSLEQVKEDLAEQVKIGSLIQLVNVAVTGQIVRNSGAQKPTEKASRTEVIKACFTIPQNAIAKSGVKKVYMRIISPFGAVLGGKEDPGFVVNGRKGVFTHMKEIEYNNRAQNECVYCEDTNALTKGKHAIQFYSEGRELANYSLMLK